MLQVREMLSHQGGQVSLRLHCEAAEGNLELLQDQERSSDSITDGQNEDIGGVATRPRTPDILRVGGRVVSLAAGTFPSFALLLALLLAFAF